MTHDSYDKEASRISDSICQAFAEREESDTHPEALDKARALYLEEPNSSEARFDYYREEFGKALVNLDSQERAKTLTLADVCNATDMIVARKWRESHRR